MKYYDLVVIGLGVMGAAAAWKASAMGASVLALEAGGPTHRGGSSHGATRIYRQAYWDGEDYLELLRLADEGWRELEICSQSRLLSRTGGIFIGPKSTGVVAGSLATARGGSIPHEHLLAGDIQRRFPQFNVSSTMEAVFEPGAYVVFAEESRLQMLNEAVRNGACLMYGTRVVELIAGNGCPIVKTASGESIASGAIVVCAGAWGAELIPELERVAKPHRVPIYWFQPRRGSDASFGEGAFPAFLYEENGAILYGVPAGVSSERGVKIGFHNRQHIPGAPAENPPSIKAYESEIAGYIERIFRDLDPIPRDAKWCFYTMSKDESFIIDQSTRHRNVFFASACSGHGFKFGPAVGKVLAELGLGMPVSADISCFGMSRFQNDAV